MCDISTFVWFFLSFTTIKTQKNLFKLGFVLPQILTPTSGPVFSPVQMSTMYTGESMGLGDELELCLRFHLHSSWCVDSICMLCILHVCRSLILQFKPMHTEIQAHWPLGILKCKSVEIQGLAQQAQSYPSPWVHCAHFRCLCRAFVNTFLLLAM